VTIRRGSTRYNHFVWLLSHVEKKIMGCARGVLRTPRAQPIIFFSTRLNRDRFVIYTKLDEDNECESYWYKSLG
jgi:hypothetical protein